MSWPIPQMIPVVPEMVLAALACLVLLVDVFATERYRVLSYQLAQASLVLVGGLVVAMFPQEAVVTFNGTFVSDQMGAVLKTTVLGLSFFAFLYSKDYLQKRSLFRGEFYVLGMTAVLGMMVLISAHSLLTIYLGLELLSLSLYALVALNRDSVTASEAAMKYFVLGALASGMLLYGISLLYGVAGSHDLSVLASVVSQQNEMPYNNIPGSSCCRCLFMRWSH